MLESQLSIRTPIRPGQLLGLLMGVCFLSFAVASSDSLQAECGSYVTIGNKAKLKELRAKGYLPAAMKNHTDSSSQTSTNDNNNSPSKRDSQVNHSAPIPTRPLPCSGASCRGQLPTTPIPQKSLPAPTFSKPGLGQCHQDNLNDNYIGYAGYNCINETPWSTTRDLDRPPE